MSQPRRTGTVYLVGAGPGDPELLTMKANRLLLDADVVVYDRLVHTSIIDLVPPGTARISVGKSSGRHTLPQHEINRLLVRLARERERVVRLKGGDPFVFGRGGEEALYLQRHGIPFEVIPGVTAATACAAYAGVPLTHRGASRGVQLLTGHLRDDHELELDWRSLANADCTLVIYMGLANLATIARRLIAAGLAASTPAMAVQDGTTARQRRVRATLAELPAAVAAAEMQPPVLLLVGRTVALADRLDWFQPGNVEHADEPPLLMAHG